MNEVVKIFSYNCYLFPKLLVNQDNKTCENQYDRADGLGKLALETGSDIITLQEVWGSSTWLIQQHLTEQYSIPNAFRSNSSSVLDTFKFWWNTNGGLSFASKKHIPVLRESKQKFKVSGSNSGKGFYFCLLDMFEYWEGKKLLVVNCHLDPDHTQKLRYTQREQIVELASQIQHYLVENTDTENTGLLIVGDFNFEKNSENFQVFHHEFNSELRDLYGETTYFPHNTYDSANTLNQWRNSRIDFFFTVNKINYQEKEYPLVKLKAKKVTVLKQTAGNELSDHWGYYLFFLDNNLCS